MKPIYILAALLLFCSVNTNAQTGKIEGKVTDAKSGAALGNISVQLEGAKTATTTNTDGYFVLTVAAGRHTISFSAITHKTKTVNEIDVTAGQVTNIEVNLEGKVKAEEAATVRAAPVSARRETVNAIIGFQKNTNTVASVISAESIRRSPDRNTGEVLKRTPGASIQEGRFIVVRGLADRYNQAMINGILLTSTEPDRKTFSFDLIPANMIDNIIINKAFVPEYPGEWAGGLIQVNTKDIPAKNFFTVQVGTGFNSQTIGKPFYEDKGGNMDWLGIDNNVRTLPKGYTTKSNFDILTPAEKTAMGSKMRNAWAPVETTAPLNMSVQLNGGINTKIFGKKVGITLGVNYNKNNRYLKLMNRSNALAGNVFSVVSDFNDDRYNQEVMVGALGSLSVQLNPLNKISIKALANLNSPNSVTRRQGVDFSRDEDLQGSEFTFKQNTFFTVQANGDHSMSKALKLKWYGAFNILDGYIPDQRRILYTRQQGTNDPYRLAISNTLSQQSGSRIFQALSDYIYTAGGDLSYSFDMKDLKQTIKGGYMLQIKDRLYDAKLFANYLPLDNAALRLLPADQVFAAENFGNGTGTKFAFDAIKGNTFRYMANTILNSGFLQLDNQLSDALRVVWGARIENYDQLVGSVKTWDPRHNHTVVTDVLPGLNATYKLNSKTNIRLSGSQTVIRPELRELSFLNLYDFELNASVQGNPNLKRTKVSNFDLRYEIYPRAGEVFTAGVFFKSFDQPIEQIFNGQGGGASTFTFENAEKATSYGVELELRKKLDFVNGFKNFTFQANAAYIQSKVKDAGLALDRSLQGQSPYLLNLGLLYDWEKAGLNATLLFNQVGERIYLVGDFVAGAPDIYEAPRALVDFQVSKKIINRKGELRLNISDLLNQTQYFYQNADSKQTFQKSSDAYRFTRRFGTTFSMTFNYSL